MEKESLPDLQDIENRFKKIYSKKYKLNIYHSVLSKTRNGGMDPEKRKIEENGIPIRVPVKREVYETYESIIPDIVKKEKRMIRAKRYRELRYNVKKTMWK